MKYALVNDLRTEANKSSKGLCPFCGSELIAKCGEQKINHWAHKATRLCDSWWEPETIWHRSWKNQFPEEWQENALIDEKTGEKHIADIQTAQGLVIEFQHSFITPEERKSREQFYNNLVWVVDGTRLKRDYQRFIKGRDIFKSEIKDIYSVQYPEEYFPKSWIKSSVPVIFDFLGNEATPDDDRRKILYCLFPVNVGNRVYFAEISRTAFVKSVREGDWIERVQNFINWLSQLKKQYEDEVKNAALQNANLIFNSVMNTRRFWPRRIF
jgi:hypothetical protein